MLCSNPETPFTGRRLHEQSPSSVSWKSPADLQRCDNPARQKIVSPLECRKNNDSKSDRPLSASVNPPVDVRTVADPNEMKDFGALLLITIPFHSPGPHHWFSAAARPREVQCQAHFSKDQARMRTLPKPEAPINGPCVRESQGRERQAGSFSSTAARESHLKQEGERATPGHCCRAGGRFSEVTILG